TRNGIEINSAEHCTIGGTALGSRNIISGNRAHGIWVIGTGSGQHTDVQGNYIGTDSSGVNDIGNAPFGVFILNSSDNTIGGDLAGAKNVIAFNGRDLKLHGHGVEVASGVRNKIVQNSIFGNSGRGIDLNLNLKPGQPYAFSVPGGGTAGA